MPGAQAWGPRGPEGPKKTPCLAQHVQGGASEKAHRALSQLALYKKKKTGLQGGGHLLRSQAQPRLGPGRPVSKPTLWELVHPNSCPGTWCQESPGTPDGLPRCGAFPVGLLQPLLVSWAGRFGSHHCRESPDPVGTMSSGVAGPRPQLGAPQPPGLIARPPEQGQSPLFAK